jgi:hypothetical protein
MKWLLEYFGLLALLAVGLVVLGVLVLLVLRML